MSLERMLWMLDELKQAILHLEKVRRYWEQEERERYGELTTLHDKPVRCLDCRKLVGGDGIEPSTSAMSTQRSTSELTALRDKTVTSVLSFPVVIGDISQAVSFMSRYDLIDGHDKTSGKSEE